MFQLSKSVVINRAIQDVFDYSVDPANTPVWMDDIVEHTHNGALEVGSTGRRFVKFMGLKLGGNYEMTAFNPPYEAGLQASSGPLQFQVRQRYEEVDGGTQFTYALEGETGGFFKVLLWLFKKEAASQLEKELNTLKGILEG